MAAGRHRDDVQESVAGAFLCGRVAMAEGKYDVAARNFLIAFDAEPANSTIGRQALAANLLAGRPFAATIARAVAHARPADPLAQSVLAGIEAQHGNWPAAALHYASMSPEAVFGIMQQKLVAWAQFGAGRTDALRALLGPQTVSGQLGGITLLQEALMADLSNRPALAQKLFRAARADLGPGDFALARAMASLLARQGREAEAAQILAAADIAGLHLGLSAANLRQSMAQRPIAGATDGIGNLYVAFALLARQNAAPQLADLLLRLALTLRPDNTVARLLAAQSLAASGQGAAALAMLAPVAGHDTLAPSVLLMRANLLAHMGRIEEALPLLAALQSALPDRPEPFEAQGDMLRDAHRDAAAAVAYGDALARLGTADPARPRCLYGRGLAEERAGHWPAAEADFLAALDIAPDDPVLLAHLGIAWLDHGESPARARKMISRAATLRPTDARIIDSLGEAELRQGDAEAAVRTLQHAVELTPDDAAGNSHLGDAYAAAGRLLEARYQWDRAKTLRGQ
jgi:tetratricopeptide (TPR) repeat protein